MRTKILSKVILSLALVFVLGSAITQLHGEEDKVPYHYPWHRGGSAAGKTGSFVLSMNSIMLGERYVNFSVKGTAIAGVDYVPLISPAHVGKSGYGVILVRTLPDRRGPASRDSYSVVVTLEPGPGYAVGEPKSAQMMIKP
jgi:hypothetical protein